MNTFANYIRKHWRGELPLAISFWVNYVLVTVALRCVEWLGLKIFVVENPVYDARLYVIYSIFVVGILMPWQVIGLWRACVRQKNWTGKPLWSHTLRVLILLTTLSDPIALIVHWPVYKGEFCIGFMRDPFSDYKLEYKKNGRFLYLKGELGWGVSRDIEKIINANPQIKGVIFNSPGGYGYEGRQLANLITAYGLNTYACGQCDSACTLAFIAGKKRFIIGDYTKLGFHQSRPIYEDKNDIEKLKKSDKKDHLFFERQGVKKEFLERVSKVPSQEVWYPSQDELLKAGVIHGIITPREIMRTIAPADSNGT